MLAKVRRKRISISIITGLSVKSTEARSWWSINIPDIDNFRTDDDPVFKKSSRLLLEDTYFLYGFGANNNLNTNFNTPGLETIISISNNEVFPQLPSNNESDVQMVSPVFNESLSAAPSSFGLPTWSPSKSYQSANGGCPSEHKLHRLWLYDSYNGDGDARYGDGWGSTILQIWETLSSDIVFEGTLDAEWGIIEYVTDVSMRDGHTKRQKDRRRLNSTSEDGNAVYLCLNKNACYIGKLSGGTFTEECSWEVTVVELETGDDADLVARGVGVGLGMCAFGLKDSCDSTCDGTVQKSPPAQNITKSVPSPSAEPSRPTLPTPYDLLPQDMEPSKSPSTWKTKRPTLPTPSDILPQDMLYGADEFNRIKDIVLDSSPTSGLALEDPDSPQSQALAWIYTDCAGLPDEKVVQRWALASFYFGTNGDNWVVKDGWLQPQSECSWYGVSCLDGVVTKLELEQNRLAGFLVPEIAVLKKYLYVMSLGNDYDSPTDERNSFIMPLPLVLSELSYLTFLNLENVGLISSIPENFFTHLTQLQSLYMNNNDITGTLPRSIKQLASIKVLWLGGNNMDGSIISEIGNLTSLVDLSLESNFRDDSSGNRGFISTLPSEIGRLTSLEILSLANNALSGQLPLQMGDLISLRNLNLRNNFFESQLPTAFGKLEMLEQLDVSHNWLSSTIPSQFGDMMSLKTLSLESNYKDQKGYFTWGINGKLPSELGRLKNLQHLHLNDNYLTGTLVTEIGQLFLLETLHLQNNFLQGPIPETYSNCVLLKEILLQENSFDSQFRMPEGICRLPELDLAKVDCSVPCTCCLGC